MAHWRIPLKQVTRLAFAVAPASAGRSRPASTPITAIVTNNSTSVKPRFEPLVFIGNLSFQQQFPVNAPPPCRTTQLPEYEVESHYNPRRALPRSAPGKPANPRESCHQAIPSMPV